MRNNNYSINKVINFPSSTDPETNNRQISKCQQNITENWENY